MLTKGKRLLNAVKKIYKTITGKDSKSNDVTTVVEGIADNYTGKGSGSSQDIVLNEFLLTNELGSREDVRLTFDNFDSLDLGSYATANPNLSNAVKLDLYNLLLNFSSYIMINTQSNGNYNLIIDTSTDNTIVVSIVDMDADENIITQVTFVKNGNNVEITNNVSSLTLVHISSITPSN